MLDIHLEGRLGEATTVDQIVRVPREAGARVAAANRLVIHWGTSGLWPALAQLADVDALEADELI